jgi:hypothetical protein
MITKVRPIHELNPKRLKINEKSIERTKFISDRLNLKSHTVQVNNDRRVRIYLSATVEVYWI